MGNVDHRFKLDARKGIGDDFLDAFHHQASVAQGELHAVLHLGPVVVELLSPQGQECQAQFGLHHRVPALVEHDGKLVVVVAHLLAQVAATRVDHDPQHALLIALQLDEVVAAAQSAHLALCRDVLRLDHSQLVDIVTLGQIAFVLAFLVVVHSEGDALADASHDLLAEHVSGDILDAPIGLDGAHAAADVHAHGVGNHGVNTGQHAANGHSHACMHVGHDGQVVEQERQRAQVFNLLHGAFFHIVRPDFDGTVVDYLYVHCRVVFV